MNRRLLRQAQSVLRVVGLEDDIPEGDQRVPVDGPDIRFVINYQDRLGHLSPQ
jgi:hypothetical protein